MKPMVIAIDGPAGAGKSTVARKLAERLGLLYVDSGATYRAAALRVVKAGVSPDDEAAVAELVAGADIQFAVGDSGPQILLDGEDVTVAIRSPEVSLAAAKVSRYPAVRQKMVDLQRRFARGRGVVMEGRDIGTVVFPPADLKVFLTAAPEERARRRLSDDQQRGQAVSLPQTIAAIERRDQLDTERKISPLIPAPDAIEVDSTQLTADQVVERILRIIRERKLIKGQGEKSAVETGELAD
jgi:cytidylate kinase